jgi:hypothetical protein
MAAITLGCVALPFIGFALGYQARKNCRQDPEHRTGKVIAAAGQALAVLFIVGLFSGSLFPPEMGWGRQAYREAQAVVRLREITKAETLYREREHRYGSIADLMSAQLLDNTFAEPYECYEFGLTVAEGDYNATATPSTQRAGRFGYYSVADGVVRYSSSLSMSPAGHAGAPVD